MVGWISGFWVRGVVGCEGELVGMGCFSGLVVVEIVVVCLAARMVVIVSGWDVGDTSRLVWLTLSALVSANIKQISRQHALVLVTAIMIPTCF